MEIQNYLNERIKILKKRYKEANNLYNEINDPEGKSFYYSEVKKECEYGWRELERVLKFLKG